MFLSDGFFCNPVILAHSLHCVHCTPVTAPVDSNAGGNAFQSDEPRLFPSSLTEQCICLCLVCLFPPTVHTVIIDVYVLEGCGETYTTDESLVKLTELHRVYNQSFVAN